MKHLLGRVNGVRVSKSDHLQTIMFRIAEKCEFTVVSHAFHQFEPIGTTGVLVLAESHFSAHTYPEHTMVYIDVFCCAPSFDPDECSRIIEKEFSALSGDWKVVDR